MPANNYSAVCACVDTLAETKEREGDMGRRMICLTVAAVINPRKIKVNKKQLIIS